jgi:hypothetical protein
MPIRVLQFDSNDGCTYIFDLGTKQWHKVSGVEKLPTDVRKQIYDYLKDAEDDTSDAESLRDSLFFDNLYDS